MRLKVKDIKLSSGGPYIVVMNEADAEKLDLTAMDRARLVNKRELVVFLNIAKKGIKPGQIGLFEEVMKAMRLKNNDTINVYHQTKPESVYSIKKKLSGERLTAEEIDDIVKDVVVNKLSVVDLTYFVFACYTR